MNIKEYLLEIAQKSGSDTHIMQFPDLRSISFCIGVVSSYKITCKINDNNWFMFADVA